MHGETRRGTREFVGARIRKFRTARGLSLGELADLSDIAEMMIGQMEIGRTHITFENLLCLARALEVPVVDFFGDEEGDDGDNT
jgi:transcriptional regulator with XRE-family HTH domain